MVMKIRCTACGSAKFTFTDDPSAEPALHGARCASCNKRLTAQDLLPNTPIDPITRCLVSQMKKKDTSKGT
ncbi:MULTISPECIES: ECs_2282 family putative zinc-binding protein [Pantoea]|jgi:DNA-directed RNA polymerase subunit RPC12/RpoP|uniref:Uncharacterized protein n=1 Tax=Pantoea piersonii TaxID=2364647 RepID=A0AAJ5QI65_9GAMM|nr:MULTISPECIES: hypothetical protein [Pantoea]HCW99754.1 hypothetical protein [Pantoea sp.]MBZ6386380.1 hypothetical protein [Pantoea piersonii]MBZ6401005.1 hypothetical protein [Pantoea piersonii]MBZ6409197.1 hypothetical protein [Pantoea piersonii]MBZ6428976.1 hypothetical protein [Pantoea piersonii]